MLPKTLHRNLGSRPPQSEDAEGPAVAPDVDRGPQVIYQNVRDQRTMPACLTRLWQQERAKPRWGMSPSAPAEAPHIDRPHSRSPARQSQAQARRIDRPQNLLPQPLL